MIKYFVLSLVVFNFFCQSIFASEGKYLITMPGPKPDIAKTFKSEGKGKYSFSIDPTKKVKKGSQELSVTLDMIKVVVEKRLKKFNAKVSGTIDKVLITYTGEEQEFLKAISKAKIKPESDAGVAVASSVSDGGVRARTSVREPDAKEIRGLILAPGTPSTIMVQAVGKQWEGKISKSAVKINLGAFEGKSQQVVYIIPKTKDAQGVWTTEAVKPN